ncbi:hypothetical protein PRVXT_002422 [Proteinivorax tanatarense]|uniref:Uncharacterized protein n=1 Tax=Proteinivorax tanatarense TaxID=1260629 RepID=A0AAU7VK22_9FIRM
MLQSVYHCSEISGLKLIKPNKSTHGAEYVYATKEIGISALFLSGVGGDFTCAIGRDRQTGMIYVCERFEGAFEYRYSGKSGSIYVLPGEKFKENKTRWIEEVVADEAIEPNEEIFVSDSKDFLLDLDEKSQIKIVGYPEKIDGIPEDDSDLVESVIYWTKKFGKEQLDNVRKYHPHLLTRVLKEVEK